MLCSCLSEIYILIGLQRFLATLKKPSLVFSFRLLDWLEAMTLECQVATQDYVTALDLLYKNKQLKVCYTCMK